MPWNPWKAGGLFHLENFKSALDAAGEWFLDRDGTLFYKPLPGQDPSRAAAFAPRLEKLVIFQGQPESRQFVENIQFMGLSFQHSQWLTPADGVNPSQAASNVDAAIMADGARRYYHIKLRNIPRGPVRDLVPARLPGSPSGAQLDPGPGGRRSADRGNADRLRSGRRSPAGSRSTTISSEAEGASSPPRSRYGWARAGIIRSPTTRSRTITTPASPPAGPGATPTTQPRTTTIEHNHIHHLGQGVLSDLGGFYSLGPSEGTTVIGNVVHDIYSTTYGGWGLYTDEGSTGITLRNNLVYNTKTGGFHQHYGRDNVISNNIFAYSLQWQVQITRPEAHRSFTFSNNIVYWTQGGLYSGPFDTAQVLLEKNLFWDASGRSVNFTPVSLRWQGQDVDATIAALASVPQTRPASMARERQGRRFHGGRPAVRGPDPLRLQIEGGFPRQPDRLRPVRLLQGGRLRRRSPGSNRPREQPSPHRSLAFQSPPRPSVIGSG